MSPALRNIVLSVSCALALPACATASQASSPENGASAMAAGNATPATKPLPFSAEEIGKRFLKLIEGLVSRDDLSLERIREVMGVALPPVRPGDMATGAWSRELGGGWRYGFRYVAESPSLKEGVGLSFQHDNDEFADMSAVCTLDFDYYHDALVAFGFRPVEIRGEIGELRSWRYYKNDIVMAIVPQNVVTGEHGRWCVKSINTLN